MSSQPSLTAQGPDAVVAKTRDSALDFTKGALVLLMALYHSLNYFRRDFGGVYLLYLRFLPPSFIFISGFLITHIYRSKYRPTDLRLHKRLLVRGVKLLAVFLLLNVLVNLAVSRNFNGTQFGVGAFFGQIPAILGSGRQRAVFEVLVPIAYLLMLGGPLLALDGKWRASLPVLLVILSLTDYVLAVNGVALPNLEFVCFGILGAVWGLAPMDAINKWTGHWVLLSAAYLAYLGALTVLGASLFVQYVAVCLTIALLYRIGVQIGEGSKAGDMVILLGKYSLLAYIGQIFSLQILLRLLRRWPGAAENFPLGLFAAVVLTIATVVATDWARRRWPLADRAYRLVFS
jgi:hypothetical protein